MSESPSHTPNFTTNFTNKLTMEEYDKSGKDYTTKALEELQQQLIEREKNNPKSYVSHSESNESESDSEEIDTDINIKTQVLKHEVNRELNKYKIEPDMNMNSSYRTRAHKIQDPYLGNNQLGNNQLSNNQLGNDDRVLHMFNDLITRNTNLIQRNSKLYECLKETLNIYTPYAYP